MAGIFSNITRFTTNFDDCYGENAWTDLVFLVALDRIPYISITFNADKTQSMECMRTWQVTITTSMPPIHLLLVEVNALT